MGTVINGGIRFAYAFSFSSSEYEELCIRVDDLKPLEDLESVFWENNSEAVVQDSLLWAEPAVQQFLAKGKNVYGLQTWSVAQKILFQKDEGLGFNMDWDFLFGKGSSEEPLKLKPTQINLTLTKHGVGLIAIDLKPSNNLKLDTWLRFLAIVRKSSQRTGSGIRIGRTKFGEFTQEWPGALPQESMEARSLYSIFKTLLMGISLGTTPWWKDVMAPGYVIPYFSIAVKDVDEANIPGIKYKLLRMASNRKAIEMPDSVSDTAGLLQYSANSWFIGSFSASGYISFNTESEYLTNTLRAELFGTCWILFCLAMQQRVALQRLSTEITTGWDSVDQFSSFERTQSRLLSFMAEAFYPQLAVQRALYNQFYQMHFDVYRLQSSYNQVKSEVEMIYGHLRYQQNIRIEEQSRADMQRTEHLRDKVENFIKLFGVPVAGTSLFLGFMGINMTSGHIPGVYEWMRFNQKNSFTATEGPDALSTLLFTVVVFGLFLILSLIISSIVFRIKNSSIEKK